MNSIEEYLMVQDILNKRRGGYSLTPREEAVLAYSPHGYASSCHCNCMNVVVYDDNIDS